MRSAIIDGVVPPQANMNTDAPRSIDRAFTQLFQACSANATCNAAYPALEANLFELVARLNLSPPTSRGGPQHRPIATRPCSTATGLLSALFQAFYISDMIPLLPEVIHRADKGDFRPLSRSWAC